MPVQGGDTASPCAPTAHPLTTSFWAGPWLWLRGGAGAPVSPAGSAGAGQGDVLQVGELHEGPVEVVQLQDAGEQEEARDEDAGEELGHAELLQAQVPQPVQGAPSALPALQSPTQSLGPEEMRGPCPGLARPPAHGGLTARP